MKEFGSIPEPAFVAVQSTAITDLIAKLEVAPERLDNETLGRMLCTVAGKKLGGVFIATGDDGSDELQVYDDGGDKVWAEYRHCAPDVSLDAATGLVGRNLPGWGYDITYRAAWGNHTACVIGPDRSSKPHTSAGATAALALCAAFLRATEAGE